MWDTLANEQKAGISAGRSKAFRLTCRWVGLSASPPHVSLCLTCPIERVPPHPPSQASHLSFLWNLRSSPGPCSGRAYGKKPDVASCEKRGGSLRAAPWGHEPAMWNYESCISKQLPSFRSGGREQLIWLLFLYYILRRRIPMLRTIHFYFLYIKKNILLLHSDSIVWIETWHSCCSLFSQSWSPQNSLISYSVILKK